MAAEIEAKVRQASGLPGTTAPAAVEEAAVKEKEKESPAVERAAKPAKGMKSEKHAEA